MDLETPITTQEQFDEAIKARLAKQSKKFEGYTSPEDLAGIKADYDKRLGELNEALKVANEKAGGYDKEIADRDAKIKGYEMGLLKQRVAREAGLPYELHTRLTGETEEELAKDAKALAALVKSNSTPAPLANPEPPINAGDSETAAYKKMLKSMKGE